MSFNHTTLGSGLAYILGVDPKYVVLRQGTWFNPQALIDNVQGKPNTWVGYRIKNAKPRSLPYQTSDPYDPLNPYDIVFYTSDVDIQIVGNTAQQLAESFSHWLDRQDVMTTFAGMDCQLMGINGGYTVTEFFNGGAEYAARSNVVLSYNVSIRVEWASAIHVYLADSPGQIVTSAIINGQTLVVPSSALGVYQYIPVYMPYGGGATTYYVSLDFGAGNTTAQATVLVPTLTATQQITAFYTSNLDIVSIIGMNITELSRVVNANFIVQGYAPGGAHGIFTAICQVSGT